MFARNKSLAEIVVALRQPPDVIRDLYREWSTSLDEAEWERRDARESGSGFSASLGRIPGS